MQFVAHKFAKVELGSTSATVVHQFVRKVAPYIQAFSRVDNIMCIGTLKLVSYNLSSHQIGRPRNVKEPRALLLPKE